MNRTISALVTAGALALTLTACQSDGADTETATASTAASEAATSAAMSDPGETVDGEVGKESGFDCVAEGDCSVLFTVEDMKALDACPGVTLGEQPAGTQLVRVPVLIKTNPSDFDYNPGEFTIWADWSAETEEGITQTLPASSWCVNPEGETEWMEPIHVGDTERHVHLMDVPLNAVSIRLTETQVGSRWEYPAPEVGDTSPTSRESAPEAAPAPAPVPAPAVTEAPAPAPAPVPAPDTDPVIGFTGAPSVDSPRILDKTIASCGERNLHETGTTFFTDGTSGWTQQCANQMGF